MLRVNIIPIVAFELALTALALALATLLVGIAGNRPDAFAIATFNISSLGLAAYHDATSPLHTNITALVPQNIIDPPSITRYLGVHDWYRVSYLSNCSGFYETSPASNKVLTSKETFITCSRQRSGYRLRPKDIIADELKEEVKGLAEDVSGEMWDTSSWTSLWYTGLAQCVVVAFELPWTFKQGRSWLNGWICFNAFCSAVLFLAESACISHAVLKLHHSHGIPPANLPGPNPWSGKFLGLTWSTTCLMWAVLWLIFWQWKAERRNGECGGCGGGETRVIGNRGPVEDWKSEGTAVEEKTERVLTSGQ